MGKGIDRGAVFFGGVQSDEEPQSDIVQSDIVQGETVQDETMHLGAVAAECELPLVAQVGALLFVSGRPLRVEIIAEAVGVEAELIEAALEQLRETFVESSLGIGLQEVAGGWQLRTAKSAAAVVTRQNNILWLGMLSLLGVLVVLYIHFRSVILSLQVMLNVPLALIGSVIAIYITERTLSVATLVAFVTLCGIATRNGILLISHYLHLMTEEGEGFDEKMVVRGSLERLVPVLMTASTAALALVPLLLSKGQPGKEILYPVATVIVGGLISSTLLDLIVTPTVFLKFGRRAILKYIDQHKPGQKGEWA